MAHGRVWRIQCGALRVVMPPLATQKRATTAKEDRSSRASSLNCGISIVAKQIQGPLRSGLDGWDAGSEGRITCRSNKCGRDVVKKAPSNRDLVENRSSQLGHSTLTASSCGTSETAAGSTGWSLQNTRGHLQGKKGRQRKTFGLGFRV